MVLHCQLSLSQSTSVYWVSTPLGLVGTPSREGRLGVPRKEVRFGLQPSVGMAGYKLTDGIESKLKVKIAVLKKLDQENRLKKLKVNVGSKSRREAEPRPSRHAPLPQN